MMGLEVETPGAIKPSNVASRSTIILANGKLNLLGRYPVPFIKGIHLVSQKDEKLQHHSNDIHRISLDQVIATMKRIGADMPHHYEETSPGGLAISIP